MKKFEFLTHTADLAIKGYGKDLPELFTNIALGMYEAMVGDGGKISNSQFPIPNENKKNLKSKIPAPSKVNGSKSFKIAGETHEDLLVNFLNELIFQAETNHQIFLNLEISKIKKGSLEFSGFPSPLPEEKLEIKAATYHDLKIQKINNHYQATVILDI